ncbi:MAG: Ig-like domain-containing protein [Bacteroidota bacterium]
MPKNTNRHLTSCLKCLLLIVALGYGCASMRSPEGGPIDKTPPVVLKMEPKNLTTNFNSQKVTITFDEYFNLQNAFKEFSISPEQEKPPLLKKAQKKLEITFQDTLEKNTTYTLNFGKAIADVHENNVLKNLTYVFSTGPLLDSLSISGQVKNTVTGKPELDAVVFLLPLSRDTLFGKKKASIYTTTDSSGHYKLSNLKKDTYKIYALKETGGDKIYQQSTDEIGFIKDSLVLNKNIDSVNIGIFKELAQNFRVLDRRLNPDGSIALVFNQHLIKPSLTVLDNKPIDENKLIRFNKTNDSLKLWLQDLSFDSVKIVIKDEDKPLDTLTFNRDKKDTYARTIQSRDNLEANMLNPYRPLKLLFNLPLTAIDPGKVILLEDSVRKTAFTFTKDTTDLLSYTLNYPWKKKSNYIITFEEGAVTGIFKAKNTAFKKIFRLASADDYGTLTLTVETPDTTKSYVLEIVDDKKIVVWSEPILKNRKIIFANYKAGVYFARIVYDENKNGAWDTGNVSKGRQPEKIWYSPAELSIKANWDRNEKLIIPPISP